MTTELDDIDNFLAEMEQQPNFTPSKTDTKEPNEQMLDKMVALGYERELAETSLQQTEYSSIDAAVEFMESQRNFEISKRVTEVARPPLMPIERPSIRLDKMKDVLKTIIEPPPQIVSQKYLKELENIPEFRASLRTEQEPDLYKLYLKESKGVVVDSVVSQLSKAARSKKPLQVLDLSNAGFDEIDPVCEVIIQARSLKRLAIEFSNLNDGTLQLLLRSLTLTDKLDWLSLAFNYQVSSMGLRHISLYIQKSEVLKYVDLSGLKFDFVASSLLGKALIDQPSLQVLKLESCLLNGDTLAQVLPGVLKCKLRILTLRMNKLTVSDASMLAQLIAYETCTLEKLDLGDNSLGTQGAIKVMSSIPAASSKLRELCLAENGVDSDVCFQLGEFLKINETLQFLDLSFNRFGTNVQQLQYVKEGLIRTKALKSVMINSIGLGSEGVISLAEALAETKTLQRVQMLGNDAACNPLKANIANVGQNVLAFGQKAFMALTTGLNSVRERSQSKIDAEKIVGAPLPTGLELATSAFMAIHAAMKLNSSLVALQIFDDQDVKEAASNQNPTIQNVLKLHQEIQSICERNARVAAMKQGAGVAQLSESNQNVTLEEVGLIQEHAKTACRQLKELVQIAIDTQKMQPNQKLLDDCIKFRQVLLQHINLDVVVREDKLADRLLLTCAELASVISLYEQTLIVQGQSTEEEHEDNFEDAAAEPLDAFEIGED